MLSPPVMAWVILTHRILRDRAKVEMGNEASIETLCKQFRRLFSSILIVMKAYVRLAFKRPHPHSEVSVCPVFPVVQVNQGDDAPRSLGDLPW